MRAGELRHKVTIQSKTESRSDTGQVTYSWSDTATVWASIEPLSGRELEFAQAVHSETDHKITVRYTALTSEDRIKFGDRTFEVLSVKNPHERNIKLEVMCKERT